MMRRPIMVEFGRPHFRLLFGAWSCVSIEATHYRMGYGYSWRDAYADWQQQSDSGCALSAAQSGE